MGRTKIGIRMLRMISGVFSVWLLNGCSSAPVQNEYLPPREVTQEEIGRAGRMAELWRKDPTRGVLFRQETFLAYRAYPDDLIKRLKHLNINCVYFAVEKREDPTEEEQKDFAAFASSLIRAGIRCEILLYPHAVMPVRSHMAPVRWVSRENPFAELLDKVVRINRHMPDDSRISGITIMTDVHVLTSDNPNLPAGQLYRWRESDYGIGSDNDFLMREFFEDLKKWRGVASGHGLDFSVAVPALYLEKAAAEELSKGSVRDFLDAADRVIVLGYGGKPSLYLQSLRQAFRGGLPPKSAGRILCGMVLAGHSSERAESIRRRDWKDFMRILQAMHEDLSGKPGYGGMVLLPYDGVELLLEH